MELITLDMILGPLQIQGIVDSRSMVNLISQEMADVSRLPTIKLKEEVVDIKGVNGAMSQYFTKIPMMVIYHLPFKLTTLIKLMENVRGNPNVDV